jgi:heme/copper-type cytochrome/quinol oxidase subunit 4
LIVRTLPYFFSYGFLLYFLEMEKYITAGWVFYTLMFFLVPIAVILLCMRLFYWIREKRSSI